jgi:hypothetical protein
MTDLTSRTKVILLFALLVPPMAGAWLLMRPEFAGSSTYAIFTALVISTAAVAIHTWKNAQSPASTSELIHQTEVAVAARTRAPKR